MSQFIANVKAKLDDTELKQLDNLKDKTVDVRVNLIGDSSNFIKTISSQISNNGRDIGRDLGKSIGNGLQNEAKRTASDFVKNLDSSISKSHIDDLVKRLNLKGVSSEIVSSARKSLEGLVKDGIQITKIAEQFSEKGLISLKIEGIDSAENAVSVLDKLNKKSGEWSSTTTYTQSFKSIAKEAQNTKKALLDIDEVQRKLYSSRGKTESLMTRFGNVDEFREDLSNLATDINTALSQIESGSDDVNSFNTVLSKVEATLLSVTTRTSEWSKANKKATSDAAAIKKQTNDAENTIKRQAELLSRLESTQKQAFQFVDIDSNNYSSYIVEEFRKVENAIRNIKNLSDVKISSNMMDGLLADLKRAGLEIKIETKEIDNALEKFKKNFSTGKYIADSKVFGSQFGKYENQSSDSLKKAKEYLDEYNAIMTELQGKFNATDGSFVDISDNVLVKKFESMEIAATKYRNAMREVSTESSKTLKAGTGITKSNEILTYYNNNTKAIKKYGQALKDLAEDAKKINTQEDLDNINRRFRSLKSTISAEGLTGNSFFADLKRATSQIAQFTGIYGVLQNVMQDIPREMVQEVIKVDDAMTNLRMATSVTNKEAQSLMKTYSELGNELKATGVDVATSATEWLKQGKSIQEAQNLASDSIVLSKIGDISSEEATKTITAAMKSYDLAENEVMGFIDKISSIDLVSATDVGGLSQAFNEVAANAKNAGVEAEKLLAYAAVIGETSQEGMASVGTSLNAVFSRMGNIKLSRLKDYETGEDLSNVETVLRGVGISLRDSQDQFREFDDVLDETANKWKDYSTVQQRAIAQAFSGTNHMNEFMILMQNWEKVQEYTKTATEASGQSMEKFSAYQESATGKIEGFKNAFQSLSTTVMDSDLFKGVIDSGTAFLNLLTQILDVGNGIPAMLGLFGGVQIFRNLD